MNDLKTQVVGTGSLFELAQTISVDLARRFPTQSVCWPQPNDQMTYLRNDDEIVSFALWQHHDGRLFVKLAWTNEGSRRKGLYRMLVNELRRIAIKAGYTHVGAAVHGENADSIAAHEFIFGREELSLLQRVCCGGDCALEFSTGRGAAFRRRRCESPKGACCARPGSDQPSIS